MSSAYFNKYITYKQKLKADEQNLKLGLDERDNTNPN